MLSHNGFDVDKKMASVVPGIDVILSGHTHDALPEPVVVGETIISLRLEREVRQPRRSRYPRRADDGLSHQADPDLLGRDRPGRRGGRADRRTNARHTRPSWTEVIGQTDSLLYRRGNFNGTWDDLICDALLSERDAEIALSPGVRWGPSLIPGQDITREDIFGTSPR